MPTPARYQPDRQRYELAPLMRAARIESDQVLADITGVSRAAVQTWWTGGLNWRRADEVACAVGLHPGTVWPEEWWNWGDTASETDVMQAA